METSDRTQRSSRRSATASPPARPTVSLAAAVVIRDGHVLAVRRSFGERFLPGVWGVPCGKLDPGETPESAVLRELFEETGLTGKVLGQAGERTFQSEWRGRTVLNRQTNFVVYPLTLDVTLPEPDQAYRWVPLDRVGDPSVVALDAHNLGTVRQALDVLPHL